jgi:hypothetical protein
MACSRSNFVSYVDYAASENRIKLLRWKDLTERKLFQETIYYSTVERKNHGHQSTELSVLK